MITEVARHGASIPDIGKGSGDHDAIEAGKYTRDRILVVFYKRIYGGYPWLLLLRIRIGDTKKVPHTNVCTVWGRGRSPKQW